MSWSKLGFFIFWAVIVAGVYLLGGAGVYYIFALLGVGIPFVHSVLLFALLRLMRVLTG
ncbi:hypothetical protein [Brevibacillus laterosporus]|uniref:hypothetical protein n=1 Tax=Brevibacillus laterosporus TaxID=1465 RepID=UPI00131582A6|nr:hypothetical protein [Brevibacillus laterosporus]